ncbi:hypothetical protein JOC24_006092 [Streptomyces sp. HB132]|nr:hypothetical protein [Streptomyces sp. HB132]
MRKIILMMSVSLDGFFEGPDRELDRHLVDEEVHGHFNRRMSNGRGFPGRPCHLRDDGRVLADRGQ